MFLPPPQLGVGVPPATWGEFVALPENTSAVRAVRRVGRAITHAGRLPDGPLVLHGSPGTGKTCLVQTLIHKLAAHPAGVTLRVVPAREFAEPGLDDEDQETREEFSDLIKCDLLVIEDVQHLRGKSAAALCQVFDRRAARRRATIVTGSAGPAGLSELPRRLTTRLAAGLVIRLDSPGVESRRALAEYLAGKRQLPLTADALDELAADVDGIRPLMGRIEQLRTLARGYVGELNATAVRELLTGEVSGPAPVERIVAKVAAAFGVTPKTLMGRSRLRTVLLPRQVAMYLAREAAKLSLPQVATAFGRDHTTVLHAVRKVEAAMAEDVKLKRTVRELHAEVSDASQKRK